MFIGRAFGSRLARAYKTDSILRVSMICALASFTIAWSFTWWPLVILGLFLTGLSISVHWPLSVSRAVVASDGLTDRAAGLASVAASVASGLAPFALGALSQTLDFHLAFLIVPGFLICALAILLIKPVPEISATT
jgi:fucose permease